MALEVHPAQLADVPGWWYLIFFEAPAESLGFLPRTRRESLTSVIMQALWQVRGRPGRENPNDTDLEIASLDAELEGIGIYWRYSRNMNEHGKA